MLPLPPQLTPHMADSTAPVTPSLPPCVSYSMSSIFHVIYISAYSPISLPSSPLPSDLTLPLPCSHHYHQTPHIWQILLNLPQPYPTTLLYLAQIPHSPLNICPSLLSCIPTIILTTIWPYPAPPVLPLPPQLTPHGYSGYWMFHHLGSRQLHRGSSHSLLHISSPIVHLHDNEITLTSAYCVSPTQWQIHTQSLSDTVLLSTLP